MISKAELIKRFSDYVYYFNAYCTSDAEDHEMLKAVLTLLKEHEAVKPQLSISGLWYECPICHRHLTKDRDNYCARCGKPVLWEGR